MTFIHSPRIVTDGLIMYLDAANPRSYPGSGTAWNDLSGNKNNGTLTNGPTFDSGNGGSINFDGSNDYVELGNILNVGTGDFTLEMWYYRETQLNTYPKIASKGAYQAGGWRIIDINSSFEFNYGTPQTGVVSSAASVNNRWNHGVITRLNGSLRAYSNTQGGNSVSFTGDLTTNSYTYQLATSPNGGENWKGRLAIYRHYNIGFTQNMVLQNFNATRSRFGV